MKYERVELRRNLSQKAIQARKTMIRPGLLLLDLNSLNLTCENIRRLLSEIERSNYSNQERQRLSAIKQKPKIFRTFTYTYIFCIMKTQTQKSICSIQCLHPLKHKLIKLNSRYSSFHPHRSCWISPVHTIWMSRDEKRRNEKWRQFACLLSAEVRSMMASHCPAVHCKAVATASALRVLLFSYPIRTKRNVEILGGGKLSVKFYEIVLKSTLFNKTYNYSFLHEWMICIDQEENMNDMLIAYGCQGQES